MILRNTRIFFIALIMLLSGCATTQFKPLTVSCHHPWVPVEGYTKALVGDAPLSGATIKVLETGTQLSTNEKGQFGFCAKPGAQITLELTKKSAAVLDNYQTVQSATVIVPPEGLTESSNVITFQVPRKITYAGFESILVHKYGFQSDSLGCNVVTTVTAYGKTLADDPQGEPGSKLLLWHGHEPIRKFTAIYFGIMFGKTNPLSTNMQLTSEDGGVMIYNLAPSKYLYYLSAEKTGKHFTKISFLCRPHTFINLSPPYGPTAINP